MRNPLGRMERCSLLEDVKIQDAIAVPQLRRLFATEENALCFDCCLPIFKRQTGHMMQIQQTG
jgi:hypothetical protein